jgi:hypothetical protein
MYLLTSMGGGGVASFLLVFSECDARSHTGAAPAGHPPYPVRFHPLHGPRLRVLLRQAQGINTTGLFIRSDLFRASMAVSAIRNPGRDIHILTY